MRRREENKVTVKIDHAAKRCIIWIGRHEQAAYAQSDEYRATVRCYRAQGYRICVSFGESAPLLPGAAALRDHQRGGFL